MAHDHDHRQADRRGLTRALVLISAFMLAEVIAAALASSLALLSDAAHMLSDAAALAVALVAARLAARPARGAMTFGLGRAEILSAQANGITLLILAVVIVYDAILRLVSPPAVHGTVVLVVALVGIAVNLIAARLLAPEQASGSRSLNVEGSYRHILTDLYGFLATAAAAVVILATGFDRADPIASLLIAALMLRAAYDLLKASARVFMEAAPVGVDPAQIGNSLASEPEVVEVHDLHVWEVTSGFPALSAHIVVRAEADCHERRRQLQRVLEERFGIHHSTLQVDHETAPQGPLQIEIAQTPRQ
jgi:cobalt-zinc-cadmium efflux system protein